MDFHAMKRKALQALCKKHNIPANLKNLEMANRLASLFKIDDEKPKEQLVKPCLKNLEDLCVVDDEMDEGKEPKKVRFSPQSQMFVFEKTDPRAMRVAARRRNSMAIGEDKISKEEVVSALEDGKENRKGKTTVTHNTRQQKRDRGVDETISAAEDAPIGDQCRMRRSARVAMKRSKVEGQMNDKKSVVEVQDKAKEKAKGKSRVTCNGKQKRGRGVNETVTATEDASIADQYLQKRTHVLNDKKLGVKGQEKGVSLRNKQPKKQGNSDEQTRWVGKRKLSMKHVEDLHTDSLAKSVDSVDNSEVGDLVNSFCEVVDLQNMPCNDSSVDKDNQGKSQNLHQTKSPTPLLDDCNSEKAVEGSCEASILIKELTEEKDMLNKESSSERVVLIEQQEDSVFSSHEEGILLEMYSSGGEKTKEEDEELVTDKEAKILNGQSKTSPKTTETLLLSSGRFKTSSPSAIVTVLSCTEDSKAELESSDPKVDSTSIDNSEISLRVCETVFQGKSGRCDHDTEGVTPTATVNVNIECSEGIDTCICDRTEYAEDDNGLIDDELKGEKLFEAFDIVFDNNLKDEELADENMDVSEEKGDTCRETHEVSERRGDVCHSINRDEFGSNSQNKPAIVLQGKSQHLHQTKSPTPLLDECNSEKAVEGSCEASILMKELSEEKDMLNKESSSEKVVLMANSAECEHMLTRFSIDAILAYQNLEKAGNKGVYIQAAAETTITTMADDVSERIVALIGDSTDGTPDCERSHKQGFEEASNSQLSSGEESFGIETLFQSEYVEDERNVIGVSDVKLEEKTSSQSADIVLSPSSGLKTSPYKAISVSRSCSEGRKTELANSASKFNSWIQSASPLKSTSIEKLGISVPMCELGSQGTYHHETATPSSMIVECDPHNEEVSSIKNSESEDQFITATISSNEQGQLTWTSSIVDSATPKENQSGDGSFIFREGGINPDLCNLLKHEPVIERIERSDGVDNYISAINHMHGVEEITNSQTIHEDANGIAAEKGSVVIGNDNHEDADSEDQNMEVCFHEEKAGRLEECYQDADGVTPTASDKCSAESEINHKQEVLEEETNSQSSHEETNGIAAEKDNVVISNVHEERNMIYAQLIEYPEDLVKADQDLKVQEEIGNIVGYIQEAEEAPTAMIGQKSECSHSPGDTTDCEKSHKQGHEAANFSQLSSGEESYGIATLFESEYSEDDNGDTCRETREVSERQGDVCHSINREEFGSNSQNKPAIVLQGSEDKLIIQSSVDGEKTSDENGTLAETRAMVELIGPSLGCTELEEDFIGLAVLERTTKQTEQQSGNENFSLTQESEKSDGENFSLTLEALGADSKPERLLYPELSVTKMDDQSKSAYVIGICKQDVISSPLEMNPLNDEAYKVENSSLKPNLMMDQNKRSILIHGTLRRPIKTTDMKENSILHLKRELNLGDATAFRPMAKRKALEELHKY